MRIDDYSFGRIKIGGKTYVSDVIVYPDKVMPGWWRERGHEVGLGDLREVVKHKPDYLIIGTGAYGMVKVSKKVVKELEKLGIKVIVMPTKDACRKFNELVEANKKVVAALHLTC